jgi:hypothetical protein
MTETSKNFNFGAPILRGHDLLFLSLSALLYYFSYPKTVRAHLEKMTEKVTAIIRMRPQTTQEAAAQVERVNVFIWAIEFFIICQNNFPVQNKNT